MTKTEGYALESSQPKEGDTVDFNDLDANQFDGKLSCIFIARNEVGAR